MSPSRNGVPVPRNEPGVLQRAQRQDDVLRALGMEADHDDLGVRAGRHDGAVEHTGGAVQNVDGVGARGRNLVRLRTAAAERPPGGEDALAILVPAAEHDPGVAGCAELPVERFHDLETGIERELFRLGVFGLRAGDDPRNYLKIVWS